MRSASEKHAIVPEEIRSVTAKCLWEELGLPSFGVALQFVWALFMSDSNEDGTSASIARMDEIEVSKWLEIENLNNLALLFFTHSVTGKGVEVLQPTDMMDMGLSDSTEIIGFLKARTKLMGCTEQCRISPYSKACLPEPPATIVDPSELSQSLSAPVTPEASISGSATKKS